MAEEHGDEYLNALATFVEHFAEALFDGNLILKLKPLGLLYLESRFSGLSELEALRADAPVDYLRAVVADLGDHRKLEKLRGLLRMIERIKVVGANAPLRDSTPLRLTSLTGLRHVELNGCDLSTVAATGLLELKPTLETLVCVNSTDSLADLLADRSAPHASQTPWSRLTRLSCPLNHLRLMDPSLCLLPAVEEIDLSRNKLTTVANLHNCVRLTKLDLGCNSIASLVGFNRVVGAITQLVLRGNGIHSLAGLEKLYAVESLDLAHNVVGSLLEVARLGRLPSLTQLWLAGNPLALRRHYRAEVLGLLQDGEKVVLDGRQSSTFERFAIRRQQRQNARAPRFPAPVPPFGRHVFAARSATSDAGDASSVPKGTASRTVEPETATKSPDENLQTRLEPECIMEHPEENPERMFSSSPRALLGKRSPGDRPGRTLEMEGISPDATTSSAEEEGVSEASLGGERSVKTSSEPLLEPGNSGFEVVDTKSLKTKEIGVNGTPSVEEATGSTTDGYEASSQTGALTDVNTDGIDDVSASRTEEEPIRTEGQRGEPGERCDLRTQEKSGRRLGGDFQQKLTPSTDSDRSKFLGGSGFLSAEEIRPPEASGRKPSGEQNPDNGNGSGVFTPETSVEKGPREGGHTVPRDEIFLGKCEKAGALGELRKAEENLGHIVRADSPPTPRPLEMGVAPSDLESRGTSEGSTEEKIEAAPLLTPRPEEPTVTGRDLESHGMSVGPTGDNRALPGDLGNGCGSWEAESEKPGISTIRSSESTDGKLVEGSTKAVSVAAQACHPQEEEVAHQQGLSQSAVDASASTSTEEALLHVDCRTGLASSVADIRNGLHRPDPPVAQNHTRKRTARIVDLA